MRAWRTTMRLMFMMAMGVVAMASTAMASTLSDVAKNMPAGTWAELPTNGFTPDYLRYPGGTGSNTTQYMGHGSWDPVSKQVLFVAAAHYDNSQFHVYSEATNTWTRGTPLPGAPVGLGHGYNHNGISVSERVAAYLRVTPSTLRLYSYAIDTKQWTIKKVSYSNDGDIAHALVYFPERGKWYVPDGTGGKIREFDHGDNSWGVFTQKPECFGGPDDSKYGYYHQIAAYSPVRKEIVFGGGNTGLGGGALSKSWCKMDAQGNVTVMPLAPHTLRIPEAAHPQDGALVTIDPATGDLLVLAQDGNFYAFNFSKNSWDVVNDQGTRPAGLQRTKNNVTGGFIVPIDTYGVVMVGDYDGSNPSVWLYKHGEGGTGGGTDPGGNVPPPLDTVPPSPPTDITFLSDEPPPPPVSPGTNFADICKLSTTIFCQDFNELPKQTADLTEGIFINNTNCTKAKDDPATECPVIDAGTMKFTIPSNSGSGGSGQYYIRFADHNGGKSIGPGEEVYVQWKQRFSKSFLETKYEGGGGWKQGMIGAADEYSCASNEIVVQNTRHNGFPQMYHACGYYQGFTKKVGAYDFDLQPGGPSSICSYTDVRNGVVSDGCFTYYPDEWMTFQLNVTHGADGQNSRIRLWAAREGQPSELVIDFSRKLRNNKGYGKMWFLPYNTSKSPSHTHPTGYTWYDQLIISRVKLPDPS